MTSREAARRDDACSGVTRQDSERAKHRPPYVAAVVESRTGRHVLAKTETNRVVCRLVHENQVARDAQPRGVDRRRETVIRAQSPERHYPPSRSGERIPEDPLELPGLVPAVRTRARVIPLDVERSDVGLRCELLGPHDRRRQVTEHNPTEGSVDLREASDEGGPCGGLHVPALCHTPGEPSKPRDVSIDTRSPML